MKDYIEIENLIIFANHGVFDEEKSMGQRFMVSLKLYTDVASAARNDDISDSVNYGEVCRFVTEYTQKNRSRLIETAAENIAYALLDKYDKLIGVEVQLKKPWAPIGLPLDNVLVNVTRKRTVAYIGMGSNMGDKKAYLDYAVKSINDSKYCSVTYVSEYIETEPIGFTEQDRFLNACAEVETVLPARELLNLLNKIESDAGRTREIHWGPRTLDLDILLYGNDVILDKDLIVPHKEMAKREFVLRPLCEIAPNAFHPLKNAFVSELLEALTDGKA